MLERIPAPEYDPDHPFQAHVTNLDADNYVGRLALCRVRHGTVRTGPIAWCRADGSIERAAITELYITEALSRVAAEEAGPGEIIAVAGLPEVTIGETLADPEDPRPLPVITVDEPSLSIVVGINTSPLAGTEGQKLTARQIQSRLDAELVGNVSIRVNDTERPDTWEVQGRGELQLVILLEMMRREGFELTAGQPRVITREIDGKVHEPVERLAIDVPEEHVGAVTQLLAGRKGRLDHMSNHATGWVRMDYLIPARGLIGLRTEFLTETRGTGILHHVFDRWEPWAGDLRTRPTGSLVADRRGSSASYSLHSLQDRGTLFVGPGEEVYEGMIVGENGRSDDLDVNAVKEKQQTNVRAASADILVRLSPPKQLSLESALEFLRDDECLEITPDTVRLRKVELDKVKRQKTARSKTARLGVLGLEATALDRLEEGGVVALVLVGVGGRELGDRRVEGLCPSPGRRRSRPGLRSGRGPVPGSSHRRARRSPSPGEPSFRCRSTPSGPTAGARRSRGGGRRGRRWSTSRGRCRWRPASATGPRPPAGRGCENGRRRRTARAPRTALPWPGGKVGRLRRGR